jgi:hypothetical protein
MIVETFFLMVEKRSIRTPIFRQEKTFHHLCTLPPDIS